jgi:hypothetical protein
MAVRCTVVWNGEEYEFAGDPGISVPDLLGMLHARPHLQLQHLALFSMEGIELEPSEPVYDGQILLLRPRVIH